MEEKIMSFYQLQITNINILAYLFLIVFTNACIYVYFRRSVLHCG